MLTSITKHTALVTGLGMALLGAAALLQFPAQPETQSMIVQGQDLAAVRSAVEAAGGEITHELGIINAVTAKLSPEQTARLRVRQDLDLYDDGQLEVAGGRVPDTQYPTHIGADLLHDLGLTGSGVTIAIVDTGVAGDEGLAENSAGESRLLAGRRAVETSPFKVTTHEAFSP